MAIVIEISRVPRVIGPLERMVDTVVLTDWPWKTILAVSADDAVLSVAVCAKDSGGSGRNWMTAMDYRCPEAVRSDSKRLQAWIWQKILRSVHHELAERFSVAGKKPFYPHPHLNAKADA